MEFEELLKAVKSAYEYDNLSRESSNIIQAHRDKNKSLIRHYADRVGINDIKSISRLFMKIIPLYHPDRYEIFQNEISGAEHKKNPEPLKIMARHMAIGPYGKPFYSSTLSAEPLSFSYREVYEYDLETEVRSPDYYDRDRYGFIEAVNDIFYGNLDFKLTPGDLSAIHGELNLAYSEMEDLEGLEYCYNVTDLDLSGNNLGFPAQVCFLHQLESLNLSDNELSSIDGLKSLESLVYLDISSNDLEDISVLRTLYSLVTVNVLGNPLNDLKTLDILKTRGVTVLHD